MLLAWHERTFNRPPNSAVPRQIARSQEQPSEDGKGLTHRTESNGDQIQIGGSLVAEKAVSG
ncbi:MAG: hypothetical protein DWH91_18710 [Planctomycetota bacterium]|nr:MAG: hypothetical protein DWH91_18710 [Planctomycetota bacterium]